MLATWQQLFAYFDEDAGGTLESTEIKKCIQSLGFNPTDADMPEWIKAADGNDDGAIDFMEFCKIMKKGWELDAQSVDS